MASGSEGCRGESQRWRTFESQSGCVRTCLSARGTVRNIRRRVPDRLLRFLRVSVHVNELTRTDTGQKRRRTVGAPRLVPFHTLATRERGSGGASVAPLHPVCVCGLGRTDDNSHHAGSVTAKPVPATGAFFKRAPDAVTRPPHQSIVQLPSATTQTTPSLRCAIALNETLGKTVRTRGPFESFRSVFADTLFETTAHR